MRRRGSSGLLFGVEFWLSGNRLGDDAYSLGISASFAHVSSGERGAMFHVKHGGVTAQIRVVERSRRATKTSGLSDR